MQPGTDTSIDIIFQDNDVFENFPERIKIFIEKNSREQEN